MKTTAAMSAKALLESAPAAQNGPVTLVTGIVDQLRFEILGGKIQPGAKLRPDDLKNKFEVSLTPVREALMRLSSEGLVISEDQRGFRVAPVSLQNLKEVTELRVALECLALRLSIEAGDLAWESNIVAAAHRLAALTSRRSGAAAVINEEWELWHRKFHLALIAACNMPLLIAFCKTANDLCDRYRRLYLPIIRPVDRLKEHNRIAAAACKRDVARAVKLLTDHIRRTEAVIIAGVNAVPGSVLQSSAGTPARARNGRRHEPGRGGIAPGDRSRRRRASDGAS
jgi:GntR family carbon starvation induced transcriptional regulator